MMSGNETEVKRLTSVETRLPRDLYERLVEKARVNERSVAAELRRAVRVYLEAEGAEAAA